MEINLRLQCHDTVKKFRLCSQPVVHFVVVFGNLDRDGSVKIKLDFFFHFSDGLVCVHKGKPQTHSKSKQVRCTKCCSILVRTFLENPRILRQIPLSFFSSLHNGALADYFHADPDLGHISTL